MDFVSFHTALMTLMMLDQQEPVDAGALADRDYKAWDAFKADPARWYLKADDAIAEAVWGRPSGVVAPSRPWSTRQGPMSSASRPSARASASPARGVRAWTRLGGEGAPDLLPFLDASF